MATTIEAPRPTGTVISAIRKVLDDRAQEHRVGELSAVVHADPAIGPRPGPLGEGQGEGERERDQDERRSCRPFKRMKNFSSPLRTWRRSVVEAREVPPTVPSRYFAFAIDRRRCPGSPAVALPRYRQELLPRRCRWTVAVPHGLHGVVHGRGHACRGRSGVRVAVQDDVVGTLIDGTGVAAAGEPDLSRR